MTQGLGYILRHGLLGTALLLAACASNPPAEVDERSTGDVRPAAEPGSQQRTLTPEPSRAEERHVVAHGDTLYAIAFKRGVDFRDLAAWNNIAPPYRIFVGQELRLSAPPNVPQRVAPAAAPTIVAAPAPVSSDRGASVPGATASPQQNPPVEKSTKPQPSMFEDVAAAPTPTPPPAAAKPVEAAPAPVPPRPSPPPSAPAAAAQPAASTATQAAAPVAPVASPPPPAPSPKSERVAELSAGGVSWRWPGEGKVTGTFVAGDQIRQGIDIAGKAGDPVRAAADGEVVYSGNGLLGYGELIIVKHNANFLSAYGHNRQRLVKEGDRVKAGQQIAELGSSATAREELHFEIRRNGKPVNPLDYLPVR